MVSVSTIAITGTHSIRTVFQLTFVSGFEHPSAIQQRAIKPMMKGRDVIAQAQSGTGKTATFSIAMLQCIDTQLRDTQVLCLSPTRELAVQIQKVQLFILVYIMVEFT